MIDIESRLVDSLHADSAADRPVDTAALRAGALARARTIRTRRRAVGAFAAAGLVVVISGGAVGAIRPGPGGAERDGAGGGTGAATAAGATSGRADTSPTTTLPPAGGAPTAAERPEVVGTDPAVLHFDVDFAALGRLIPGLSASQWRSGRGYEMVTVPSESGVWPHVEAVIAPDPEVFDKVWSMPGWMTRPDGMRSQTHDDDSVPITVQGKPGTMRTTTLMVERSSGREESSWDLLWQPRNGLYAYVRVFNVDRELALTVADTIRFDRAQRCAVPLRLANLPAGATWTGCRSEVRHQPAAERGVWRLSELLLDLPGGGHASVWAEEDRKVWYPQDVPEFTPNRTVAGRPAQWRLDQVPGLWLPGYGPAELFVSGVAEPDAVRLVEGLELAEDLARPESWPHRPVG